MCKLKHLRHHAWEGLSKTPGRWAGAPKWWWWRVRRVVRARLGYWLGFLSECRLGWNLEYVTVILTLTLTDTDTTSSISLSIQSIYPTTCNSGWWWALIKNDFDWQLTIVYWLLPPASGDGWALARCRGQCPSDSMAIEGGDWVWSQRSWERWQGLPVFVVSVCVTG